MKAAVYIVLLTILCCLTGCTEIFVRPQTPKGHYFLNPHKHFSSVNRVLLIELENNSAHSEISEILTQSLANALSKKHLFTIQTIYSSDPLWTTLNLSNIGARSYQDLAYIQKTLKVDAVIFGTIKRYQSFPHLQVALNLKMLDVNQGDLVWAMEQVWDSSDKQVGLRMRKYYSQRARNGYQPLDWKILVTSPRAFNKFVVDEVGDTFPKFSEIHLDPSYSNQEERYLKNHELFEKQMKVTKKF